VGIDIDPQYCRMAARHLKKESSNLFLDTKLIFEKMVNEKPDRMRICEDPALYEVRSARKLMQ
jgi:site-specific DNA-methyltransferase (adenine-specific)